MDVPIEGWRARSTERDGFDAVLYSRDHGAELADADLNRLMTAYSRVSIAPAARGLRVFVGEVEG